MKPYDGRLGGGKRRSGRRRVNQRSAFLVLALFLALACTGTLYYVIHLDAQESLADMNLNASGEHVPGESAVGDGLSEKVHGKPAKRDGDGYVPPEETPVPEETYLVVVDAGHGGKDGGSGREGVLEKEVNLEIAKCLAEKLEEMGFEVLMIREDNDTHITKQERAEKANEAKADAYISIHQNTYEEKDNEVSGVETYYCEDTDGSERFAKLVHSGVVQATGAKDRNTRETDGLYVIREAKMPSCLVEVSFLTNKKEREKIVTAEYQDKVASGMAEGIYSFFYGEDKK